MSELADGGVPVSAKAPTVFEARRFIHAARHGVGVRFRGVPRALRAVVEAELKRLVDLGLFQSRVVDGDLWARSYRWRGYDPDELRDPAEPFAGILAFRTHLLVGGRR